mmetsp:Transcript_13445/g.24591  ORF Transcript_13445/g.24591 Transcript_13445/m.24591 type:complete len:112 (-) Transcript_13445:1429-1764(-)
MAGEGTPSRPDDTCGGELKALQQSHRWVCKRSASSCALSGSEICVARPSEFRTHVVKGLKRMPHMAVFPSYAPACARSRKPPSPPHDSVCQCLSFTITSDSSNATLLKIQN